MAADATSKRQGAGSCATETCRSATARAPCRATGSPFSATRKETVPFPWPSAAEVIVIHPACEAACHVHSRATVTRPILLPPVEPNDEVGEPTLASHRPMLDGLVTLVDAELPQATGQDRKRRQLRGERVCRKIPARAFTHPDHARKSPKHASPRGILKELQRNNFEDFPVAPPLRCAPVFPFLPFVGGRGSQACGAGHALVRAIRRSLVLHAHRLVRSCQYTRACDPGTLANECRAADCSDHGRRRSGCTRCPYHRELEHRRWRSADIVRFVRSLPQSTRPLVLLLQEVYRDGPEVPAPTDRGSAFTRQLGSHRADSIESRDRRRGAGIEPERLLRPVDAERQPVIRRRSRQRDPVQSSSR